MARDVAMFDCVLCKRDVPMSQFNLVFLGNDPRHPELIGDCWVCDACVTEDMVVVE